MRAVGNRSTGYLQDVVLVDPDCTRFESARNPNALARILCDANHELKSNEKSGERRA
jgi:hypothetical protein